MHKYSLLHKRTKTLYIFLSFFCSNILRADTDTGGLVRSGYRRIESLENSFGNHTEKQITSACHHQFVIKRERNGERARI